MYIKMENQLALEGMRERKRSAMEATSDLITVAYSKSSARRLPRYLCLHSVLKGLIDNDNLSAGQQLPPDEELAGRLHLSLGTVQKTMQALKQDLLVERRHGAGTFVVDPAISMHDVWHFRFLADGGQSYLPLKATAKPAEILYKKGPWSDYLKNVDCFVRVTRRIFVNEEFAFLSDFYFDGERFSSLVDQPREYFDRVVLRNVLTKLYGVRTKNAEQLLSCQELSWRDCSILGPQAKGIGMILETFGIDQADLPIYYQRVAIPSNDRKLVLDQT